MSTLPVPPEAVEIDPQRLARVDRAREGWIKRLIDLSRRNNLLYFRELKTGTLELTGAATGAMKHLLSNEEVPLSRLLPANCDAKLAEAKLREIHSRAVANSEERGIETLFLAMGMATWDSKDGERPAQAAILLVPIKVEARSRGGQGVVLRRAGDIQANLVLLHLLETEYGVVLAPEELLAELQGDDEGEDYDTRPVTNRLVAAARSVAGFKTNDRLVIGNFAFQKTAMVRDLREFGDQMARHDLIAALAGDPGAREAVRGNRFSLDPAELDQTPPENEFLFLDADSSQQLVIRQALQHQDGTIQGPPGTGKSQTIANLIAEFAAQGRRVLFVAEKRAALEVVLERLRQAGLDHLALDLHGAEVSRRQVMAKLESSLELVGRVPPVDSSKTHARVFERRARLVEHVRRLHSVCAPTARTVYQVQGRLLQLGPESFTRTRWRGEALLSLDERAVQQASDLLIDASAFRDLFLRCSDSPWNGASLADGDAVRAALERVASLSASWPRFVTDLGALCQQAELRPPATVAEWRTMLALLHEVQNALSVFSPAVFQGPPLSQWALALAPAKRGALSSAWAFVTQRHYRAALRAARGLALAKRVSPAELCEGLLRAERVDAEWRELSQNNTAPRPVPRFAAVLAQWEALEQPLGELDAALWRSSSAGMPLAELSQRLDRLAADRTTPGSIPKLCDLEQKLEAAGIQSLVEELRATLPEAEAFAPSLEHAWLASAMEHARTLDPELAGFKGRAHDAVVDEFRKLDRERIRLAAERVRRAHAEKVVEVMNQYPAEASLVMRECQKKYRGLSIRKLLAGAPHVLTTLRPCWMASPLSVSHLLPADRALFDVVLFDEASQVLPEDAMPAVLRGERAVVAGDKHQLPPTTFFVAGEDAEGEVDEDAPSEGFESILDLMSGLFESWSLDWHYRSLDESLITFSNHHIYGDRLVTFPGPGKQGAVEHVLVHEPAATDDEAQSVSAEVQKVVELVLRHAVAQPTQTLGVISMGIKHQRRIELALDLARRDRPELDAFFDTSKRERFFVKNLERVQGDERDAIILTVGYGKDRAGKLPYRFGPLLYEGGERRLNVAVTRARRQMTVVSSFDHRDMDPKRSSAKGVELLRLYLEFTASGGRVLGDRRAADTALNDFEEDVRDALTQRGLQLLPQWGASRYRIDLVAQHPTLAGRLVLAIECDGASYHSAQSARDRDRLRQQHLEALGWRFHRIWSTDWFLHRDEEIERAMKAFESAVAAADRGGDAAAEASSVPSIGSSGAATLSTPTRGPRPILKNRDSIDQYREGELVRLIEWVQSDGLLRRDEQIVEALVEALGFERRGSKIVTRINQALQVWRRGTAPR